MTSLSLALFSLSLAACPPSAPPPNQDVAGVDAAREGGAAGSAFCAKVRELGCPSAAMCEASLDPVMVGVTPACSALFSAFVSCIDANAASVTCAAIASGPPPACAAQYTAVTNCAMAAQDGGAPPADGGGGGACSPDWGGTWTGPTAVYTTTGPSPSTDMSSPSCPPTVTAMITQTGCNLSITVAGQTITSTANQAERGTGLPLDHYTATGSPEFDFAMRFAPQDNVENPNRTRLQYTRTTGGTSISCFYAVTRN